MKMGENKKFKFDVIIGNIWSPFRMSLLRSPLVLHYPLPGPQQICSQVSTAWSDGPVDSWEHICYKITGGAMDSEYLYAAYHT